MVEAGKLYASGKGVRQDYAKARGWFERAAGAGSTDAMINVGLLHANGQGVPQDDSKAYEWFVKATGGPAAAMTDIGRHYAEGRGVTKDDVKAREWFERATADNAYAMAGVGDRYAAGRGVPLDYAKAREWYEKAASAALAAQEFERALDAAERALAVEPLQPEPLRIEAKRAHALMLLERADEAREVYLAHKDERIAQNDNKTWQQLIAEDFAELRKAGLDHPQMAEIEAALGIAKP